MRSSLVLASLLTGCLAAAPALAQAPAQAPAPPDSSELAKTLDAYSSFHLAEAGRHVKGAQLPIGHLTITVTEGTAIPILSKDGTVAGLYFTGSGGWAYKS